MKRRDRIELLKALSEGLLVVAAVSLMWLSLMNWRGVDRYGPPSAPFLQADKGEVTRLTPGAMADHTYWFNKKQEAIARGE